MRCEKHGHMLVTIAAAVNGNPSVCPECAYETAQSLSLENAEFLRMLRERTDALDDCVLKGLQASAERDSLRQHLIIALRHIGRAQRAGLTVDWRWLDHATAAVER